MSRNWETRDQWETMADCPFCGAKASEFAISLTYSTDVDNCLNGFMGECAECAAMGPPANSESLALRLWNRRASMSHGEKQ